MTFEKFTKVGGRGYTPKAAIWKRGQIGFNQGAVRRYNLKDYNFAILFYDKDQKKIGVKFVSDANEEGANKIVKGQTGIFMSAKAFLDYYQISYTETKRYDVEYDEKNDFYVFKHD